MNSVVEEFGPLPQAPVNKEAATSAKKRAAEDGLSSMVQKKLKTHSECTATELMAFPLLSSRQTKVVVRVCTGHVIYLQNNDKDAEAVMKQSTLICGFGRGDFQWGGDGPSGKGKGKGKKKGKQQQEEEEGSEGTQKQSEMQSENRAVPDVAYTLQDAATQVLFNGQLLSLGQVVREKRETDPKAEVLYTELIPSPTAEVILKIKMTHDVRFVPAGNVKVAEEPAKKPNMQLGAASLVPLAAWGTGLTKVAWAVRWTVNGLMPVRPQVVAAGAFTVPANQAVQLA